MSEQQQLQQQHDVSVQTLQREHESSRHILQQKVLELQVCIVPPHPPPFPPSVSDMLH